MATYSIHFHGRLKHAIGIRYACHEEVEAEDSRQAILQLYEKYDSVHHAEIKEIQPSIITPI